MTYIRNQRRQGFSPIIEFCGRQRLGKTRQAILNAYYIDKENGNEFDLKEQLHVNALNFVKAYDKFSGRPLIYDEAGKDLDPMRAMDDINRAVSHVLQSQAYKGNPVFIILPFASDIGKAHRKQIDAVYYVYGRGKYKLYACFRWHADINDTPIRQALMEDIINVPQLPAFLEDYYRDNIEKQTKRDIMTQEVLKLTNREEVRLHGNRPSERWE